MVVSGIWINLAPRTPSCAEAELSTEIFASTLGVKNITYIQQNKPILSFQISFLNINGICLHITSFLKFFIYSRYRVL